MCPARLHIILLRRLPHRSPTPYPYPTLFRSLDGHERNEPIAVVLERPREEGAEAAGLVLQLADPPEVLDALLERLDVAVHQDRKSTRLNSSHQIISYAVFCLEKKILRPTRLW